MSGTPRRAADGLTSVEAASRLAHDGPNRLPPPHRPSALARFAGEMVHFFALMLWVAGGLAIAARLPQLGIAIFGVIVVNAGFAFIQQGRADRAAERLRELLPARVVVRRDGRPQTIEAHEVVVGDLLLLEPGDRVPADAIVDSANCLTVDTSLLTGESEPSVTVAGDTIFAGTFVVEGASTAVVAAVGTATRLAGIARMTTIGDKPQTPLARELNDVVRIIAVIAVGVGALFFGVSILLGNGATDGFVFAIGVTVALVPEALLPTVTLSLAWGAERMAKRNVLVRDLEAVETLGSTTFICTDKTGTLTMNQMTVVEAWTPTGNATTKATGLSPTGDVAVSGEVASIEALALAAARCGSGYVVEVDGRWVAHGDPMEAAVDVLARRLQVDIDADRRARPEHARFPFDPRRRRMSVVIDGVAIVKGAPDAVLPLCHGVGVHDVTAIVESQTRRGLRVLAVATRDVDRDRIDRAADVEHDLTLLGLVALEDPPRADVHESIVACRRAGVRIAMVTGDHPATAAAIGLEVGLREATDPVLIGADLPVDDAALGELLDHDGVVIARVAPEDKLRIARVLRARGHVVAMTGDGVNDAPALHEANIGIAMGASGTDVAREAADLVLLDDHFASIVAGIEQGRATYVNIRRFLTYHLTDNVAEVTPFVVWVLSGGSFPLALGVLQILALDIGTDTLSAVALGAEPASPHLLDGPPVSGRLMNRTVMRRSFGVLGPTIAFASMTAFLVSMIALGWRPGRPYPDTAGIAAASGAAFITVVLGQKANVFACRSSTRTPRQLGWTTNRLLLVTGIVELAFAFTVLWVPALADQLDQANPPLAGWLVAVASMPLMLAVDALDKRSRNHRRSTS
jgi:calcium-translocating P-type ATPase